MGQGDAFAGRREQRAFLRVAQRPHPQRIAGDEHVAAGVQVNDVVGAVEPLAEAGEQLVQGRPLFARRLVGDEVQQDFGVGLQREMLFGVAEDLVAELRIVGQLPVEGEAEPLAFFDVPVFERLGVAAVLLAAGGVAHVADRGRAGVPPHDRLELGAVVEPKHLADRPHVFPFHQQLVAVRIVGRHAGGQLAPVLHVDQHAGDHPRGGTRSVPRDQAAGPLVGEMVDGGQTTLVEEFRHQTPFPKGFPIAGRGPAASRQVAGSGPAASLPTGPRLSSYRPARPEPTGRAFGAAVRGQRIRIRGRQFLRPRRAWLCWPLTPGLWLLLIRDLPQVLLAADV